MPYVVSLKVTGLLFSARLCYLSSKGPVDRKYGVGGPDVREYEHFYRENEESQTQTLIAQDVKSGNPKSEATSPSREKGTISSSKRLYQHNPIL